MSRGNPSRPAPQRLRAVLSANTSWYLFNFRRETIAALVAEGCDVFVLAPDADFASELEALGARFRKLRLSRKSLSPLSNLATFLSYLRAYRTLKPNLVHHFTIKPVILGGAAARLLRVPAIVQAVTGLGHAFTGSRVLRYPALLGYRFALGARALTILQNPEDQATLLAAGVVRPERTILIRGSGVDLERFGVARETHDGPVTFVMACRMLWSKGVREFVQAADLVVEHRPECRFVLVGAADSESREGVPVQWLREATAARPHLRWLGFVLDIAPILQEADVMVLPSYYGEGIPKSLLEGAAARLPLISTDMPGCRELAIHEKTGLVVPPRDAAALGRAMLDLANSPQSRASLGMGARNLVESDFGVQSVVAATLASYRKLIPKALAPQGSTSGEDPARSSSRQTPGHGG